MFSPLIDQLINHFRCLPGVGPKSAERMTLYLLEHSHTRQAGLLLAKSLMEAIEKIGHCQRCRTLSELSLCKICSDSHRDSHLLCVVEKPNDVVAIEQTYAYKGYYFVLMGHLSPIEGIGPTELGIQEFIEHIKKYTPKEIILATSSTVEGETTAHYLNKLLKNHTINISRIAYGIPLGNELGFVDSNTLMQALSGRKVITDDTDN